MEKITGVKSVDFKIKACGYGVVNWNGPTTLMGRGGENIDNHSLPKLRGYSSFSGRVKDNGYKYRKEPEDINFVENRLYISQNCIRHHLFRDHAYDLHYVKDNKDLLSVLCSITGLVRGYAVPAKQYKRTSPLLLEDFVDQLGKGNFEQMGRSGSKEKEANKKGEEVSNSFFSKTTFGETEYNAYGSINIEQLQFISLDKKFDRAAMNISEGEGEDVAQKIQDFIQSLDPTRFPKVTFHPCYVRKGTIFKEGEAGLLLNNEAIDIVIKETLEMIENLSIKQAKGYMYVEELTIDYNDSHKMMRIKRSLNDVPALPDVPVYAVYFEAK